MVPVPVRLRCCFDDADAFELLEPLRQQGTGESGRALQDLAEASAAKVQVADDQRCPALGEDLCATRDRAVLAVRPHDPQYCAPASGCEVQILDLTVGIRGGRMRPSRRIL